MQYFGGKHRIAKELAKIINAYLQEPGAKYVEPFCGALNVTQWINPKAERLACDFNLDLILLYQAIQNGYEPPGEVSEARYKELQEGLFSSAERGFVGFACSFAGGFFKGYARGRGHNFADIGKRGLAKKFENLDGVEFRRANFLLANYSGCVIYCDPPYSGTTAYSTGKFDSAAFWQKVRELSADNLIFISEYNAPDDFIEVWRKEVNVNITVAGKAEKRIEKLYTYI